MFLRFYTVVRYLREREAVKVACIIVFDCNRNSVIFSLVLLTADASIQKASQWLWHDGLHIRSSQAIHQPSSFSLCHLGLCSELCYQHLLPPNERHSRCLSPQKCFCQQRCSSQRCSPAVVSKVGQKTVSGVSIEITTQPMYVLQLPTATPRNAVFKRKPVYFHTQRYVWNNMWMIQSSISTVGYGDLCVRLLVVIAQFSFSMCRLILHRFL